MHDAEPQFIDRYGVIVMDFTSYTTMAPPTKLLTGQTVAKTSSSKRERAERAADWMQGRLHINRPTARQAATVFGASTSLITVKVRERTKRGCPALPAPAVLDALFGALDFRERAAFIMRNESAIWKTIDKLTA